MSTADFFYISVSVGIWVMVIFVGFLTYQVIKFVVTLRHTIEDLNLEYKTFKSGVKLGALTLISKFLGKKKGGGKNK